MVSPISARLLAGTRDDSPLSARLSEGRGDAASQGSSSSKGGSSSSRSSQGQKRTSSGVLKNMPAAVSEKLSSSVSGYSGDREDQSVLPPVLSIDLHGRENSSNHRNAMSCPKRQKTHHMQFAATTAKDDLERAGMKFQTMNRDLEEVQVPGTKDAKLRIKIKGVRLLFSSEVSGPLISSNVSKKASVADYASLLQAVRDSYPAPSLANIQSLQQAPCSRDSSASSTTSSVSDTESDCGSDNINKNGHSNQLCFLPPRVEDSLDFTKAQKWNPTDSIVSQCHVISCASNATTMTESLQLSKEPRYVKNNIERFVHVAFCIQSPH
jgi:hypothetical protein